MAQTKKTTSTSSKKKTSTSKAKKTSNNNGSSSFSKTLNKKAKKIVKKQAKKNPLGVIIGGIIAICVIALTIFVLYKFEIIGEKKITGPVLNGKERINLNIGDKYIEEGVSFIVKNNKVSEEEYSYSTLYYTKGVDKEFETADDINVDSIDTSQNNTFLVKYDIKYKDNSYSLKRYVNVGIAPLSINVLTLGNQYNGDSIYIKAGETDILIDAGSRKNSSSAIYNHINSNGRVEDGKLEYVIVTHAHQDHIAGFVGSKEDPSIFDRFEVDNVIQFSKTESTTQLYKDYQNKIESIKDKTNVYTALQCYNNLDGAKRSYEIAPGTTLNILYNIYYEQSANGNENLYSVCLSIDHGNNHYLLTGDLEEEGEEALIMNNSLPQMDFYKANHHGSYTASSENFLSVIKPKTVAISCVAGSPEFTKEKNNMFPSKDGLRRIEQYTDKIYVTSEAVLENDKLKEAKDLNGVITFKSEDGKSYNISCSNSNDILKNSSWYKANR